ncbi:L,D-transpeptidase [Aggregatilinea lenta]|uniref:L,D-transpeptidase n=1 Tax=Aggregatilinea lenta TaxID=913108 RepID=UPI000E5B7C1E|nr:L,D-transpeptidase [Aggregatilinea lenta]
MHRRSLIIAVLALLVLSTLTPASGARAAGPDRAACLQSPFGPGCTAGLPSVEYQMLLDEMLLHPAPNVRQVPVDEDELLRFAFRKIVGGTATIYDAPDGNAVGQIDEGFNYVTVTDTQGDWIEINDGQWMPASQLAIARPSDFTGVYIDGTPSYTMAWMLLPTYPSPAPGAEGDQSRPILERYTRVNIFATTTVNDWEWYLIGPDTWVKQTQLARVLFIERPPQVKGRWFAVDLFEQVLVAYEDDTPVYTTLISSGLPDWETNEGTFTVWARQVNGHMSGAEGQTDFYSLENVPWVMYFDNAISLHGTYWHDGFGYRHSHGCVNMSITDAHWVYQWSMDGGYSTPYVHVFSSGEYK